MRSLASSSKTERGPKITAPGGHTLVDPGFRSVVDLAVDAILVLAARIVLNAILGIEQQDRARSKDHSAGRTHACASRLPICCRSRRRCDSGTSGPDCS